MLATLVTAAVSLAVGIPSGAVLRRRLLCSPTCQAAGVYLWTEELERAAWDRGRNVGLAEGRGELTDREVAALDRAA